jgi:hypothetical protein
MPVCAMSRTTSVFCLQKPVTTGQAGFHHLWQLGRNPLGGTPSGRSNLSFVLGCVRPAEAPSTCRRLEEEEEKIRVSLKSRQKGMKIGVCSIGVRQLALRQTIYRSGMVLTRGNFKKKRIESKSTNVSFSDSEKPA